jgi:hypothetical protein
MNFFEFVLTIYATQSSRLGVPRQAMVSPLSGKRRRPSTFASGFRLASMGLGSSPGGFGVSRRI